MKNFKVIDYTVNKGTYSFFCKGVYWCFSGSVTFALLSFENHYYLKFIADNNGCICERSFLLKDVYFLKFKKRLYSQLVK